MPTVGKALESEALRDVVCASRMTIAHPRARAAQKGIGHTCADRVSSKLGSPRRPPKTACSWVPSQYFPANSAMMAQADDHNSVRLRISMPVRGPRRLNRH